MMLPKKQPLIRATSASLLLLLCSSILAPAAVAAEGHSSTSNLGYGIISRQDDRHLQRNGIIGTTTESPSIAPVLPSFDGDLEEIYDLALKKSGFVPSDYPSLVPASWNPPPSPTPFGSEGGSGGGLASDRPSLVPSLTPSYTSNAQGGGEGSNNGFSDVPSLTPSMAPSSVFSNSGSGGTVKSDYPSLIPVSWPTSPPPASDNTPSGVPSDAPSLVPSPIPPTAAPTTTFTPTFTAPLNPHSCTDSATGDSTNSTTSNNDVVTYLIVSFTYTLETAEQANVVHVVSEGEEVLQETIAPRVLSCLNPQGASSAHIVALDSLPKDTPDVTTTPTPLTPVKNDGPAGRRYLQETSSTPQTDQTCTPVKNGTNVCSVWEGYMRFFLSDKEAAPIATGLIIQQIEDILNSKAFVMQVGTGLVRSHFIKAESDLQTGMAPNNAGSNSTTTPDNATKGPVDTLAPEQNITPMVLVGVGSAAIVVFVGSIYYWKRSTSRGRDGTGPSSAATQMAGSSFNETTVADLSNRQSSPFSEMLPDSYRFNENMSILSGNDGKDGMSAIMEDEEAHSQTSSAIFMSESGFSESAGGGANGTDTSLMSFDIPKSLYTRVPESPNLLGARKRHQDQIMVVNTDSGEDTSVSDIESSSVVGDDEYNTSAGMVIRKGAYPMMGSLLDDSNRFGHHSNSDTDDEINNTSMNNTTNNNDRNIMNSNPDDSMQADELLLFC